MYGPAVRCKSFCRDSGERDIDADYGDRAIECSRHGVLLDFGVPDQLPSLAGQEHGRTIPLAELVSGWENDHYRHANPRPYLDAGPTIIRILRVLGGYYEILGLDLADNLDDGFFVGERFTGEQAIAWYEQQKV